MYLKYKLKQNLIKMILLIYSYKILSIKIHKNKFNNKLSIKKSFRHQVLFFINKQVNLARRKEVTNQVIMANPTITVRNPNRHKRAVSSTSYKIKTNTTQDPSKSRIFSNHQITDQYNLLKKTLSSMSTTNNNPKTLLEIYTNNTITYLSIR